ncbi:MAG: hypothetical protein R6V21_06425 [Pelovirga sp.]
MKFWQGLTCSLACAALALLPAVHVEAASVSGRSSTVLEWFDTAAEDTAVPAFQYLQLSVKDVGADGYNIYTYGRLGYDLADELSNNSNYADSRLYLAYLEKRGFLTSDLDFRLGRQFISTTAGASVMDGLRLDYRLMDNYQFTLFGGGDVAYYEGYSVKDLVLGAEFNISDRFVKDLDLGLSYVAKVDDGHLAMELIGFDLEYDFNKQLFVYSETQYDYLSDRVSYFLAGANFYASPRWSGRLEYLYSLPVFSSTSIYSVFAVDEYEEIMGEATYRIGNGWKAFGRYTYEIYPEFSNANVLEAGVEKRRTEKYSGYLTGVFRDDKDGQDLYGFKLYLASRFTQAVQAGVGVDVDVLERSINYFDGETSSDDTTSSRYWVDATWFITNRMELQAKVERIESDLWDYYNRGRIRLNVTF